MGNFAGSSQTVDLFSSYSSAIYMSGACEGFTNQATLNQLTRNLWQIFEPRRIPTNARRPAKRKTQDIVVPWDTQPEGLLEINRDHPMAKNLVFASAGNRGIDWYNRDTTGAPSAYVDGGFAPGQYGYPVSKAGSLSLFGTTQLTIVAGLYMPSAPAAWYTPISVGYWNSHADNFNIGLTANASPGQLALIARYNDASINFGNTNWTESFPYKKHVRISLRSWGTSNADISIYEDAGVAESHMARAIGLTPVNSSQRVVSASAACKYVFVFNRDITATEDRAIRDNPWQLFKPRQIPANSGTPVITRRETEHFNLPSVSQPQDIPKINKEHWLARYLYFIHTGLIAFIDRVPIGKNMPMPQRAVNIPNSWGGHIVPTAANASTFFWEQLLPRTIYTGFTLSVWVQSNGTSLSNSTVLSVGLSSVSRGGVSINRDGNYNVGLKGSVSDVNGSSTTSSGSSNLTKVQHACLVYGTNGVATLYIDGVLVGSSAARFPNGMTYVRIGASSNGNSFGEYAINMSTIGLPMLISRPLSSSEVLKLYKEQLENPWGIFESTQIPYDQSALIRQLEPLTPTDGYTPRILLEQ